MGQTVKQFLAFQVANASFSVMRMAIERLPGFSDGHAQ
jgi:hypothetical protein